MQIDFSRLGPSSTGSLAKEWHRVWPTPHIPPGPNAPEELKNPYIEFTADGCAKPGYVRLSDDEVWKVEVCADIDEMKGWLRNYVKDKPQEARTLLEEMQELVRSSLSGAPGDQSEGGKRRCR